MKFGSHFPCTWSFLRPYTLHPLGGYGKAWSSLFKHPIQSICHFTMFEEFNSFNRMIICLCQVVYILAYQSVRIFTVILIIKFRFYPGLSSKVIKYSLHPLYCTVYFTSQNSAIVITESVIIILERSTLAKKKSFVFYSITRV